MFIASSPLKVNAICVQDINKHALQMGSIYTSSLSDLQSCSSFKAIKVICQRFQSANIKNKPTQD